jgi:RNA polymerase sigma-70 factor (ECF subfamily)
LTATTTGSAEAGLVAAARAGDDAAFRALVTPYEPALLRHCRRMLGSAEDAQDVVQDTLLRAWSGLGRFEERSTVHTWLHRIATNACLDELARRPRRPEPVLRPGPDDDAAADPAPTADPADRYAERERMELAFLTAIRRLPGRQRAAVILFDVLGWSAAEVATTLGTSVIAVNSALQRARATLDREAPVRSAPRRGRHRTLLDRYVAAWERADIDGLVALLADDAVLTMPPQAAVHGDLDIGLFFAGVWAARDLTVAAGVAGGRPAVLVHERTAGGGLVPHRLLVLHVGPDGRIARVEARHDAPSLRWAAA